MYCTTEEISEAAARRALALFLPDHVNSSNCECSPAVLAAKARPSCKAGQCAALAKVPWTRMNVAMKSPKPFVSSNEGKPNKIIGKLSKDVNSGPRRSADKSADCRIE